MTSFRRRLVRLTLVGLAGVAVVALLAGLSNCPQTAFPKFLGCPFHELTGLHCPGCGTTRAVRAVMRGDLRQAFAYNQIAFAVLPLVGWLLTRSIWEWVWDLTPRKASKLSRWVTWILVGAMVLYGVLRNIPLHPFDLLAPHEMAAKTF